MSRPHLAATGLLLALACAPGAPRADVPPAPHPLPAVVKGANLRPVGDRRRGYGTRTARQTLQRLKGLGVNTIGVLMEGRMDDAGSDEVQGPPRDDLEATRQALLDAHALGFATVLIPHLYLDDGTWRGDLMRDDPDEARAWWASYQAFVLQAASLAQATGTTALSVGVELKALSRDRAHTPHMRAVVAAVRRQYSGTLTYSANWDEAEAVRWWDAVDLAGVNGYYPLEPEPERGAEAVARRLAALATLAGRPVLVLEAGYRSSPLSHLRPWEWPDQIEPSVDPGAQSRAWAAVLTHWLAAPGVRGLMVWVIPTDPDDPASEPPHGFNPLNKPAEKVIGQVFTRGDG
ncbi:MAG: hypothetical protein KC933_39915 [Myxococcales bacterium]|nr:hypothetical protein [Myxococcales bacterium]